MTILNRPNPPFWDSVKAFIMSNPLATALATIVAAGTVALLSLCQEVGSFPLPPSLQTAFLAIFGTVWLYSIVAASAAMMLPAIFARRVMGDAVRPRFSKADWVILLLPILAQAVFWYFAVTLDSLLLIGGGYAFAGIYWTIQASCWRQDNAPQVFHRSVRFRFPASMLVLLGLLLPFPVSFYLLLQRRSFSDWDIAYAVLSLVALCGCNVWFATVRARVSEFRHLVGSTIAGLGFFLGFCNQFGVNLSDLALTCTQLRQAHVSVYLTEEGERYMLACGWPIERTHGLAKLEDITVSYHLPGWDYTLTNKNSERLVLPESFVFGRPVPFPPRAATAPSNVEPPEETAPPQS